MNDASVVEGRQPTRGEEALSAMFSEIEKTQLEFIDSAGKRIVELVTAMLGLVFAITAFGKDFPPPYLGTDSVARLVTALALMSYLLAMLTSMFALYPRTYRTYRYNLRELERAFNSIVRWKTLWLRVSAIVFFVGSLSLAFLVLTIVFPS